jgi:hypothetical protein
LEKLDIQLRKADKDGGLFDQIAENVHRNGFHTDEIIVPFKLVAREYEAILVIRSAGFAVQNITYLPLHILGRTKMKLGIQLDRIDVCILKNTISWSYFILVV